MAYAVAGTEHARALVLDEDNRPTRWEPVEVAVATGQAYAVVPHRHLLAVDLDLAGVSDSERRQRLDAYRAARARLAATCDVLEVASGQPGHRHLYAKLGPIPTALRHQLDRTLRREGMDVRTTGIRPPLSPHRAHLPTELLDPDDPATAVAQLQQPGSCNIDTLADQFHLDRRQQPISDRMWATLTDGHQAGGYQSPSEARMAFALAAVAAGHDSRWIGNQLRNPAHQLGERFRARDTVWQQQELTRLTTKAHQWLDTQQQHAQEQLDRFATTITTTPWTGQAGGTDRAVAEALLQAGRRQHTNTPKLAVSTVALHAGVGTRTARRALQRLQHAGLLTIATEATATTSTRWQLHPATNLTATTPTAQQVDLACDAARWRALGKTTTHVLRHLTREQQTTGELAGRTQLQAATLRYHLRKLVDAGLVEGGRGGWQLTSTDLATDLTIVAHERHTAGAYQQQQAAIAASAAARRRVKS